MAEIDEFSTPLMQQYWQMKAQYPDAVMLFRMGDFYETFGDDAKETSKILGITLTKRSHGASGDVDLAGFPHHAIDTYLPKLVRAGKRVAICEQLEDPKKTKKLVKRGIIELITPGLSYRNDTVKPTESAFLASISPRGKVAGVSLLDLSTGEFLVTEEPLEEVIHLLDTFCPKEIIYPKDQACIVKSIVPETYYCYPLEPWFFDRDAGLDRLKKHFELNSLKGFGVDTLKEGIAAAGAVMFYLERTHHDLLSHITAIARIDNNTHLLLDRSTIRNLEILQPLHEGGTSLADVIDRCATPMGSRLLRRWLSLPFKEVAEITIRHDAVEAFIKNRQLREEMKEVLAEVGDLERMISRLSTHRISPREMTALRYSLIAQNRLPDLCHRIGEPLKMWGEALDSCESLIQLIAKQIAENAPALLSKGGAIADGANAELDELRAIKNQGKNYLHTMWQAEIQRTGIANLKLSYNSVFGYYFEVTRSQNDKVPDNWIRKQTLVNAERYISEELKAYEEKILGADGRIEELEFEIFNETLNAAIEYVQTLQKNAHILARIDTLASFAEYAEKFDYHRPVVDESDELEIKNGRHPVIERELPAGEPYIANDVHLNTEEQILIITGPNMAGKSALLRQTALIVVLAQAGCFVPAEAAHIGIVDKIFTRIGASDNIAFGESTFMVEMHEAAGILHNLTPRSLILFDELGRGTSTYDGISIAWAVVEYLHEQSGRQAKTLFATHYHELNEMEGHFPHIRNYNIAVKEVDNKVVFLRKLERGGAEHSFGIHVAKMAGLPSMVIRRAEQVLKRLESDANSPAGSVDRNMKRVAEDRTGVQLSFFELDDPVLLQVRKEIAQIDINNLTPIEALNKLNEIKKIIG